MLKSNIIIAIRHIIKNKGLSAINIFGLSVAIAISLLSYLYLSFESSFDNFHENSDEIYLVANQCKPSRGTYHNFLQNSSVRDNLKSDIPEIKNATILKICYTEIHYKENKFMERTAFSDNSFFKMFTYNFLHGSRKTAFENEDEVYITLSFAKKLLKDSRDDNYSSLIGKTIMFPGTNNKSFTITGIIDDCPRNSSIEFDIVMHYKYSKNYSRASNQFGDSFVYIQLNNSRNKNKVEELSSTNLKKYYPKEYKNFVSETNDDPSDKLNIELINLRDFYLSDKFSWSPYSKKGDIQRLYIIVSISLLVIILACINYIMLSIGISLKRFKEVAVKKVFGSKRIEVVMQFIIETAITVILSIVLGVVIAELCLPVFNNLTHYNLEFDLYSNAKAYLFLFILFMIIVLTNSIPSIFIARQNPIKIFRNKTKMGSRLGLAKSFTIIQFSLSLILIIASTFIIIQISFMKEKDVGFNTNNLIVFNIPRKISNTRVRTLQERIQAIQEVENIAVSDQSFTSGSYSSSIKLDSNRYITTRFLRIDSSYISTLGINLLKGRTLRETDNINSLTCVVINKTLANKMHLTNPVGKSITTEDDNNKLINVEIVGLIDDFHYDSMRDKIQPLLCFNHNDELNKAEFYFARLRAGGISTALNSIKNLWEEYDNENSFKYEFLDNKLEQQYDKEEKSANIVITVTSIALLISILGLIGMTMLIIMQKIKEIGVRKINGASTTQMLIMINKEFAKNMFIASIIAIPISFWGINKWLETFAYKTPLTWWIFIVCVLFLALIVAATISYKAIRAARSNPIDAIKYE